MEKTGWLITVFVVFAGLLSTTVHALKVGESMPAVKAELKNIDGKVIALNSEKDTKGTLVIFSCNSCPWVKAWEDRIAVLGNQYQKKGFGVVVINSNDPARNSEDGFKEMQERAKEKSFEFPYVVDSTSTVARAYGATRTPEVFLFDQNRRLVYRGAIDDNAQDPAKVENRYLVDALESLLQGKNVVVAETKSVGCTIKFRPEK